uniref:Cyclin IaZm n=1 Tax=Arundo donax TaxID=35708 RepID=A0A0A9CX12_ARUDO
MLSNLVEAVDVLDVVHHCELIVAVQFVDVFDSLSSLIKDPTCSLRAG